MMSALIKQLLFDYASNRLDIDTRVNIADSIERLYKSGVFSKQDIMLLDYFYRGFSAEEIAIMHSLATDTVSCILSRLLLAIEVQSGNLDELFLQKLAAKYSNRQIQKAKDYMTQYSKEFTHENVAN